MDLSVFVDEAGDFGPCDSRCPYYLVSMLFHNQKVDISSAVTQLNENLAYLGYDEKFVIHTAPLIRREEMFSCLSPNERRALFSKLFFFAQKVDFKYKIFRFDKKVAKSSLDLQANIARIISRFFRDKSDFFQSFDRILLYYDNGQHELAKVLNSVFATEFDNFETKLVLPKDYKLFQVADLLCTLHLLSMKCENNSLTKSELLLFHDRRSLLKQFIKPLKKKELQ
ncbi:hypothetical protein SAMN05720764_10198 [Fibrobacter sp. UWH5]|uniref:DUF3800 domain-containing protein n=1 Tax=Fibrobacter sp. UWH5 TaxID=1896211 RepID=UPI000922F6AE|nr:DUF3800 domain-containing protein [Fibrobacter sp. UWH5]SHK29928.1 hypothetical protein SAMN05720764_10198 [Fibrobacter sp. UWH5]